MANAVDEMSNEGVNQANEEGQRAINGVTKEVMKQKAESEKKVGTKIKVVDANATTDANTIIEDNKINDPNAARAEIAKYNGLSVELEKINKESGNEIRQWTRDKLDERLELALAMQKQITTELKFLRKLAVKEGAKETKAAIDGILLDRQERFKDVIAELEKHNERSRRRAEREERRLNLERVRGRSRERGRERDDRNK